MVLEHLVFVDSFAEVFTITYSIDLEDYIFSDTESTRLIVTIFQISSQHVQPDHWTINYY